MWIGKVVHFLAPSHVLLPFLFISMSHVIGMYLLLVPNKTIKVVLRSFTAWTVYGLKCFLGLLLSPFLH